MMPAAYDVGDVVRLSADFKDIDGALIDPTLVRLAYRFYGTATVILTYGVDSALIKDAVGQYHADIAITGKGKLDYRWYSTGTGMAAEEGSITIRNQIVK